MKYDNCRKYIFSEIERIISNYAIYKRNVILLGFESLTKTVINCLKSMEILSLAVFDRVKAGEKWFEVEVNDLEQLTGHINEDCIIIVVRESEYYKDFLTNNYGCDKESMNCNLYDISGFTMKSMPNPLVVENEIGIMTLRECQIELVEVLDEFVHFCEDNKLRYWLDYGTLIGAVRHKGFIPWDDDIDVAMPVKDYFKFCELYKGNDKFFFDSLFNSATSDYSLSTLSKIKSKKMVIEYHTYPCRQLTGIGLDIFPLCGFPSSKDEQEEYIGEFKYYEDLWKDEVVIPYGLKEYSRETQRSIFDKMNALMLRYDYDEVEYITPAYFGPFNCPGEDDRAMKKEWYTDSIKLEFEGGVYNAPVGYDDVLKHWYHDYMTMPPVSQRKPCFLGEIHVVDSYEPYE